MGTLDVRCAGEAEGPKSPGRQPARRYEKVGPCAFLSACAEPWARRACRPSHAPATGTGASSGLVSYWGRWRRVPASAGARHLKVRRHLLLCLLRRRASWTRLTPGAPLARTAPPPARAPATPRAPRADPTPSRRRAHALVFGCAHRHQLFSRCGAEEGPPHDLRRADDPPTGRRCRRRPRRRPRRRLRPRRPRRRPLLRAVVLAKIDAL